MSGRVVLWLLGMICCVQYVIGFESLSINEDMELQKILKLHRKPVVTVIKTRYGDKYNCIDFYKQPAFDHPKLRNRTFEFKMSPSSTPSQDLWAAKIWANGKGCPRGTVPIKRYTKDDLVKAIRITKTHGLNLNISRDMSTNDANPQYYKAGPLATTTWGPYYYGIHMRPFLYNPKVEDNEYSSAFMKITYQSDLIQTGVMVNPSLFHDNRTRLFIYSVMDRTHCFNDVCPGFVIDGQIPLGYAFTPSVVGGESYATTLDVYREASNGNWVLKIGQTEGDTQVGYWPRDVFVELGLRGPAEVPEWGGEVFSESGGKPLMGSGNKEFIEDTKYTAAIIGLKVRYDDGQLVDPELDVIRTLANSPYRCGDLFKTDEDGVSFFYGGPY